MREFLMVLPEVFLVLTMALVVVGEISYHGERSRLVAWTTLCGLGGAFIQTLVSYQFEAAQIFSNTLSIDAYSLVFKLLAIVLTSFSVALGATSQEVPRSRFAEFCALCLAACLAICLSASATDALLAFLTLQTVNICGYFLAGYGKDSARSTEAGVKFLGFGALSAALLLYGLAFLFAKTHTLNIFEMHRQLLAAPLTHTETLVVFTLVFLAFGFQMALFPMHFWAPDVLDGAPTPAAGFLAIAPRLAGFALAFRFLIGVFASTQASAQGQLGRWVPMGDFDWSRMLVVVSGASMVVGSLFALKQKSAKRLVSGLVIVQSGFVLVGLLVLDQLGVAGFIFHFWLQTLSILGVFCVLTWFQSEAGSDYLDAFKGLLRGRTMESLFLVFFLLCLVGVPPLPGFLANFTIVGVALRHHWPVLAATAILSTVVSTAAVARLCFSLVGEFAGGKSEPLGEPGYSQEVQIELAPQPRGEWLQRMGLLLLLSLPIISIGVFAESVLNWAGRSLTFIFW
jgi:NADH-quinone oxidoreductase subunit N